MLRRVLVLGLTAGLVTVLAFISAIQSPPPTVEAQSSPQTIERLCIERTTGYYKLLATTNCPPNHNTIFVPDDYPLTLCASRYDLYLRTPLYSGECPPNTGVRIDLPASEVPNLCVVRTTGRLRLAVPVPNGNCPAGSSPVQFPAAGGFQTFGNIDIDVPADAGLLAGKTGSITDADTTSTAGGSVDVDGDGAFRYIPPAGFTGTDSFAYTVSVDGETEVRTAGIEVLSPTVWFVDADAQEEGDGRRLTPYNDLQILNDEVDPDEPGDMIFLYRAIKRYEGALQMEESQTLVGQFVSLAAVLEERLDMPGGLPPYMAMPDSSPSEIAPVLTAEDSDAALSMADRTMASGVVIAPDTSAGVLVSGADDVVLDNTYVYGSDSTTLMDAQPGVIAEDAQLTIRHSYVRGGTLTEEPGSFWFIAGSGIEARDSDVTVIDSQIEGGGVSLDAGEEENGGGNGIQVDFSTLTVIDSNVYGGDGGEKAGVGGLGIISMNESEDPVPTPASTISVSNSLIAGGAGGEKFDGYSDGFGGPAIGAINAALTITDGSEIIGGNGGYGSWYGGDGGPAIAWLESIPAYSGDSSLLGNGVPPVEPLITVTDSTLTGGNGGEASVDSGGSGGWGAPGISVVFSAPLELGAGITDGRALAGPDETATLLSIRDATVVTGGEAGSGAYGGYGGSGVMVSLLPVEPLSERSSLQGIPAPPDPLPIRKAIDIADAEIHGGDGGSGVWDAGVGGEGVYYCWDCGFGYGAADLDGRALQGHFFAERANREDRALQGPGSPFFESAPVLEINVTDSTVTGGDGGYVDEEEADAYSAEGGTGIALGYSGSPVSSRSSLLGGVSDPPEEFPALAALSVSNSVVTGGRGSDSDDYWGGGDGGAGITGVFFTDITIDNGSQVTGGDAGNAITEGEPEYSGDGGPGVRIYLGRLTVDGESEVTGGAGGSMGVDGGDGGDGIEADIALVDVRGGSIISGGPGGDAGDAEFWGAGGAGGFGVYLIAGGFSLSEGATLAGADGGSGLYLGGFGGDGFFGVDVEAHFVDSTVTGGDGGEGTIEDGGDGGRGITLNLCGCSLYATNMTVTGGNGGPGVSWGGHGGEGIFVEDDDATIINSTIRGGNGANGGDRLGEGAPAILIGERDDGTYHLDAQSNTLHPGTDADGNLAPAIIVDQQFGFICVNITGNTANPASTLNLEVNTENGIGITQDSVEALEAANTGMEVIEAFPDLIGFGCTIDTSDG